MLLDEPSRYPEDRLLRYRNAEAPEQNGEGNRRIAELADLVEEQGASSDKASVGT